MDSFFTRVVAGLQNVHIEDFTDFMWHSSRPGRNEGTVLQIAQDNMLTGRDRPDQSPLTGAEVLQPGSGSPLLKRIDSAMFTTGTTQQLSDSVMVAGDVVEAPKGALLVISTTSEGSDYGSSLDSPGSIGSSTPSNSTSSLDNAALTATSSPSNSLPPTPRSTSSASTSSTNSQVGSGSSSSSGTPTVARSAMSATQATGSSTPVKSSYSKTLSTAVAAPKSPARAPTFRNYDSRVQRWLNKATYNIPLDQTLFNDYYFMDRNGQTRARNINRPSVREYQNEMIQWHGFSTFADQFQHIGTRKPTTNSRGAPVTQYIVQAQVEDLNTGKINLGSITWTVDQSGICYHRMFEDVRTPAEIQALTQDIGQVRLNADLFNPGSNTLVNTPRVVEHNGQVVTDLVLRKVSINDPKLHARIHLYGVMPKQLQQ